MGSLQILALPFIPPCRRRLREAWLLHLVPWLAVLAAHTLGILSPASPVPENCPNILHYLALVSSIVRDIP